MAMSGFICHDNYYDRLKRLTKEEIGSLFCALMLYHAGREDEIEDFIGSEGIAFDFIKDDIDRMESKNEANRLNGSKGGRPKKEANESEEKRTKGYKDKDKDKDKEKKMDILFDRFWSAYPRHEAKATARAEFDKLKPDEELLETMLAAIDKQKQSAQWQENGGQYIPHPRTWLHQRRWEDEVTENRPAGKTVAAQQYSQRDYSEEEAEADRRWFKEGQENEGRLQVL